MTHFDKLKTIQKEEWENIEIYEKIDGFRFSFMIEDGILKFMKRDNKEITEIDWSFFPIYQQFMDFFSSFPINIFDSNVLYGFEILHPSIHSVDEILIYQTEGPIIKIDYRLYKITFLKDMTKPEFEKVKFIESWLKNGTVISNYKYLSRIFLTKLYTKNPEGFVLKIKLKKRDFTCKIVNPEYTEKARQNYLERQNKVGFSDLTFDSLNLLSEKHKDLNPFEFGNKVWKTIYEFEKNGTELDLFGIKSNKVDKDILDDLSQSGLRKSYIYKQCVMFKNKLDKTL